MIASVLISLLLYRLKWHIKKFQLNMREITAESWRSIVWRINDKP